MFDDTTDQNIEETVQESEQSVEQVEAQVEAAPQPQLEQPQQENKNFKNLRERASRLERERDAALERLKQLEANASAPQPNDDTDAFNLDDHDIVEGKHLSALKKQLNVMKKQVAQSSALALESRLKAQYPDIDKVINDENIALLNELEPEVAQSLKYNPDPYSKASAAYTMIKKLGIYKEDTFENDRIRAQQNAAKPRPSTSVSPQQGDSPLSRANAFANGLTDDLKKQLWREMEDARQRG